MTINWRIDFVDVPSPYPTDPLNPAGPYISHAPISGTGQPSTHVGNIELWGDGVEFKTITHTITYWVEDCNGNISAEQTENIIINPRPEIIKN